MRPVCLEPKTPPCVVQPITEGESDFRTSPEKSAAGRQTHQDHLRAPCCIRQAVSILGKNTAHDGAWSRSRAYRQPEATHQPVNPRHKIIAIIFLITGAGLVWHAFQVRCFLKRKSKRLELTHYKLGTMTRKSPPPAVHDQRQRARRGGGRDHAEN
jgi:hypothetical protein